MTAAQITLMGLVSNGEKSETFMATGRRAEEGPGHECSQRIVAGTDLPNNERDAVIIGAGLAEVDARQAGRLPDADDDDRPPARSTRWTSAWPASS